MELSERATNYLWKYLDIGVSSNSGTGWWESTVYIAINISFRRARGRPVHIVVEQTTHSLIN